MPCPAGRSVETEERTQFGCDRGRPVINERRQCTPSSSVAGKPHCSPLWRRTLRTDEPGPLERKRGFERAGAEIRNFPAVPPAPDRCISRRPASRFWHSRMPEMARVVEKHSHHRGTETRRKRKRQRQWQNPSQGRWRRTRSIGSSSIAQEISAHSNVGGSRQGGGRVSRDSPPASLAEYLA